MRPVLHGFLGSIERQWFDGDRLPRCDHGLVRLSDVATMDLTKEQQQLRERFVLRLIEATILLKKGSTDPEVTLDLLIQAADLLKQHLLRERDELREEQD
jgi:hypothetical protein